MVAACIKKTSIFFIFKNVFQVFIFAFGSTLSAQNIITDRPDQTESSSTIPKMSVQIESGTLLGFTENNADLFRQLLAPTTLFRIGITHGVELRILNQLESIKNQSNAEKFNGFSDLEVGTKIQLYKPQDKNIEIAFLTHLVFPTGSKKLSNTKLATINKLSISHELNDNIGIGYNLGYNNFGTGIGDLTYSLALGLNITEKVSIFVEPYGEYTDFETYVSNIDAGITYLVKENFQLDFSFGTGVTHTMNYISFGFSWNIKK